MQDFSRDSFKNQEEGTGCTEKTYAGLGAYARCHFYPLLVDQCHNDSGTEP